MKFTALPLTAERMADMDVVFQARGCAVAKGCYCTYYRLTHREYQQPGPGSASGRRRARMLALAEGAVSPGLLGYVDGRPAGWISFGPREDFKRLETSPTMRPVDDQPVWSVICFVVPSEFRGQGVAHQLLQAAVQAAARQGARLLEAYPVDREVPGSTSAPWFGSLSMFKAAGFTEVERHKPARPIVRLALAPRRSGDG